MVWCEEVRDSKLGILRRQAEVARLLGCIDASGINHLHSDNMDHIHIRSWELGLSSYSRFQNGILSSYFSFASHRRHC